MKKKNYFSIDSDLDFYCYLKYHLPRKYKIISLPQKAYFSEWHYCYIIYKGDKLLKKIEGNFKNLKNGELIKRAHLILSKTGVQ
jgi:hypothetical protein